MIEDQTMTIKKLFQVFEIINDFKRIKSLNLSCWVMEKRFSLYNKFVPRETRAKIKRVKKKSKIETRLKSNYYISFMNQAQPESCMNPNSKS